MKNIRLDVLHSEQAINKKNNQIAIIKTQIKAHITITKNLTK